MFSPYLQLHNSSLLRVMGKFASVLEVQDSSVEDEVIFIEIVIVESFFSELISFLLEIWLCDFRSFNISFFLSFEMFSGYLRVLFEFLRVLFGGGMELRVNEVFSASSERFELKINFVFFDFLLMSLKFELLLKFATGIKLFNDCWIHWCRC